MMDLGAGQFRRQRLAFGLPLGGRRFAGELFQLLGHRREVRFDRLLEQLRLLDRQALRLDPETPALVQRQLVGELIDLGLAPGELPVLGDEQLTQGVGVEFVEIGGESHA